MSFQSENKKYLFPFILAVSFYSYGNFGFLNLFSLRNEIRIILGIIIFLISLQALKTIPSLIKNLNAIFLSTVLTAFFSIIFLDDIVLITNSILAILIVLIVFNNSAKISDRLLKFIIYFSAIFSIMVIIQAVIFFSRPELFEHLAPVFSTSTGAKDITNAKPIQYLGFVVGDKVKLLGITLTRFCSFASEPSALSSSFYIPGLLALTFKKSKTFYLGAIILFFAIFLSQAGTIWLSIILGLCIFLIFKFTPFIKYKNPVILFMFTAVTIISLTYILKGINVDAFVSKLMKYSELIDDYSSLPSTKEASAKARLKSSQEAVRLAFSRPFGTFDINKEGISYICGLILWLGLSAGYLGLIAGCLLSYQFFKCIIICSNSIKDNLLLFIISLVLGALLQMMFLNCFGWYGPSGLLILSLTYIRINNLIPQKNNLRV